MERTKSGMIMYFFIFVQYYRSFTVVLFVCYGAQPYGSAFCLLRSDGYMCKLAVRGGAMPMHHVGSYLYHIARAQYPYGFPFS